MSIPQIVENMGNRYRKLLGSDPTSSDLMIFSMRVRVSKKCTVTVVCDVRAQFG
jgi:hypothetical protein